MTSSEFEENFTKFLNSIDINQLVTDSIYRNLPYVPISLTKLFNYSAELYKTLILDYIYYQPIVRNLIAQLLVKNNLKSNLEPVYVNNFVINSLQDLRTSKLNMLVSFNATITRTSSVRPELSFGCFQCLECFCYVNVLQKNKYTLPLICANAMCKNRVKFKLILEKSLFNDWQKVNCQESYSQTKKGAMPKTMELFVRNYCCEMLKPGDNLVITGVLTVIEEDGFKLAFMVNFVEAEDQIESKMKNLTLTQNTSKDLNKKETVDNLSEIINLNSQMRIKELNEEIYKKANNNEVNMGNNKETNEDTSKGSKSQPFIDENISKNNVIQEDPVSSQTFHSLIYTQESLENTSPTPDRIVDIENVENKAYINLTSTKEQILNSKSNKKEHVPHSIKNINKDLRHKLSSESSSEYVKLGDTQTYIDGHLKDDKESSNEYLKLGDTQTYIDGQLKDDKESYNEYFKLGDTQTHHDEQSKDANENNQISENNISESSSVAYPKLRIVDYSAMGSSFVNISQFISCMRNTPNLCSRLAESLFPFICGHTLIKHSILLMLARGTSKQSSTTKLRGDINILLVGDAGTAKSQFLKETARVIPRSVYTSGKSASAAGLTACVVRDAEGEFTIEAGALMLSDTAVCCIDEFDKMDRTDRASIHEAMEQGTITVNKAGINATLNAGCSILAAANPVSGKYDEARTLRQNIALSDAIMSRFDLFFVVIDSVDPETDARIAEKIIYKHSTDNELENLLFNDRKMNNSGDSINKNRENNRDINNENNNTFNNNDDNYVSANGLGNSWDSSFEKPFFTLEEIREYLLFIRKNIHPRLTPESKAVLVEKYTKLRSDSQINPTNYRVTVRQLESLIRLSEALAKIHCDETVTPSYVEEAYRLLKGSVIELKNEDIALKTENTDSSVNIEKREYLRILNALVYILKTKDPMNCEDLVNEYLLMREDKIDSIEQFNQEESLTKAVVSHLLHKEGVLYEMDSKIYIHPNYDA